MPIRLPPIDAFSFWLGVSSAALLGLLLFVFRGRLREAGQGLARRVQRLREMLTAGTERNWRQEVLRLAQTQHLAGTLFALDDILLEPRVLVPEPAFDPTNPPADENVNSVIPVLPEWPDLAAVYGAPTLTAAEALAGSSNLLVLGAPGTGKTTLLAHLASRVATDGTGLLQAEHTPLFVQAADLALPIADGEDVAQPLIAAAQARASAVVAAQLPRHLRSRLRDHRCAIFLDGLDELPHSQVAEVAAWLNQFQKTYSQHRLVVAAGTRGYGPLLSAGLAPVLIAPWSAGDYQTLIQQWAAAWERFVHSRKRRAPSTDTDPHLIMGWVSSGNQGRTVLEVTLKVWAAFAGDARGKRPADWLAAYLARYNLQPVGERAVYRLAAAMLRREDRLGLTRSEVLAVLDPIFVGPGGKPLLDSDDFLDDLIGRRLLARHSQSRISFHHSLVMAFCGATAMALDPEALQPGQSDTWDRVLYFFAALGELTPIVARRLSQPPDLLHSDLLTCAAWLREAPANARWRSEVLRRLSRLLLDVSQPEGLRLRALAGFAAAGDPSVAALFKQALTNPDPFARRLAVLGLGVFAEVSAIPSIAALLNDPYLDVRWAAALALSVLKHPSSIEALAQALLAGDDTLQRACAEALARDVEDGHPLLREAIAHQDLGVRRAAMYGLAATGADWARQLLQEAQHKEEQWIVRSAAQDALAQVQDNAQRAPRGYRPPDQQGWLIAWAAQQSMGVPPGRGAIDVLVLALQQGDETTRRAAAEALGRIGDPATARELYPLLRGQGPLLAEAAFQALAETSAAAGQRLAAPPT